MGTKLLRIVLCVLAAALVAAATPAFAQVGTYTDVAYVPNFADDTISVIDRATNTVVDTIVLAPWSGPMAIVVNGDGTEAYVVQTYANSLALLDAASGTVTATVPTGNMPIGAAINQDGSRVYVTNFLSESISIVDTASASVVGTIDLPSGILVPSFPVGITFTPDFSELWVASQFPGRVDIVDPVTDQVVDTIAIDVTAPVDIEFSPDGSIAYVVGHHAVSVGIPDATCIIDTTTRALISEVVGNVDPDLGPGVAAVAIAASSAAYASNVGPIDANFQPVAPFSDTITKVDLAGNTTRIPSGGLSPAGITASGDGLLIYVSNVTSGTVGVIDTTTDTLVATVPVGLFPGFPLLSSRPDAAPDPGTVEPVDSVQTAQLLIDKVLDRVQFDLTFDLGGGSDGVDPVTEDVFIQFDGLWINVPAGSFHKQNKNHWRFAGTIDGVSLDFRIDRAGGDWRFRGTADGAFVDFIDNPVAVTFRIGDDGHSAEMVATIIG